MENYIGMAAVFAAIILSKRERSVPVVILAYYALCISVDVSFWSAQESIFTVVTTTKSKAAEFQLFMVAIDTIIIISLLTFCKRTTTVKFYAAIVALSALYNALGLFFSSLSMDWYSDIYLLHQRYAIQLDVTVAWLASDNVISRKINGAFYGARKQGHEHGKPY